MNIELGPTLERLIEAARPTLSRVGRASPFWVRLIGVTVIAVAVFVVVGRSANERAENLRAEVVRLQRVADGIDRWVAEVEWPTPAESASWTESQAVFEQLRNAEMQPIAIANQLSRRGEEIGSEDVRISLTSPDGMFVPPPRDVGGWLLASGESALAVQVRGDWGAVIGFLGSLPSQLEVADLELYTGDGGVTMNLTLLTREVISG